MSKIGWLKVGLIIAFVVILLVSLSVGVAPQSAIAILASIMGIFSIIGGCIMFVAGSSRILGGIEGEGKTLMKELGLSRKELGLEKKEKRLDKKEDKALKGLDKSEEKIGKDLDKVDKDVGARNFKNFIKDNKKTLGDLVKFNRKAARIRKEFNQELKILRRKQHLVMIEGKMEGGVRRDVIRMKTQGIRSNYKKQYGQNVKLSAQDIKFIQQQHRLINKELVLIQRELLTLDSVSKVTKSLENTLRSVSKSKNAQQIYAFDQKLKKYLPFIKNIETRVDVLQKAKERYEAYSLKLARRIKRTTGKEKRVVKVEQKKTKKAGGGAVKKGSGLEGLPVK